MRAGTATQHERLLRLFRRNADKGAEAGLSGIRFSDVGDGSTLRVDGRQLHNFGSCSYLGLTVDERLKRAAVEAIEHFGPHYSSSQVYASVDLYAELEELMVDITDAPGVVIPATTTLGHLSTLPTLVGEDDCVLLDSHSHASLQLTTQVLSGRGIPIRSIAHNDMGALERAVGETAGRHRRVWYLADGVYSMLGDLAPLGFITELVDRFDNLHVYYDDAHGFSWMGHHGRGYVLAGVPWHERMVVAVGLGKGFGSAGAALLFGNPDEALTVKRLGGPMTFSGPIPPPTLGAAVASARIHLSEEIVELQGRMEAQLDRVMSLLAAHRLPVASWARSPIWLVRIGDFDEMIEVGTRMLKDGFFLNGTGFPAVPVGMAGLRFTHTLANHDNQIDEMIPRLAGHILDVVGEIEAVVDLTELETERPGVDTFTAD